MSPVVSQSLAEEVQRLVKHNAGVHDAISFDQSKHRLQSFLDDFVDARSAVTVQYPAVNSQEIQLETVSPLVATYWMANNTVLRQITQMELASEYLSAVQIVLNLTIDQCRSDNRIVRFVLDNEGVLQSSLQSSSVLRLQQFQLDFGDFNATVSG